MTVDPQTAKYRGRERGHDALLLLVEMPREIPRASRRAISSPKSIAPPPKPAPAGTIYTCPMHPQIRQVGPGNCPICGMALEPETVTADAGPSAELIDMTRRFWIGLILTVPVVALEMGGHFTNLHMLLPAETSNWIQLVLATPVVLWAGWPFFERAWASLVSRNLNMFTLIAMGTGVAWTYSVVATVAPGLFPPAFRGNGRLGRDLFRGGGGDYRSRAPRARCSNCARANRPAARSGRCSISRQNRPPHPRRRYGRGNRP